MAAIWSKFQDHLSTKTSTAIHLCPLDLAGELPTTKFGNAVVAKLSSNDLKNLADYKRLNRFYPETSPNWDRLSEFQWLIVTNEVPIEREPGARAMPWMYTPLNRDLGAFHPHDNSIPHSVEQSLFLLLLAPWEEWSIYGEIDWRGFHIPWIYTLESDLFVRTPKPPDHKTLSWEPRFYTDQFGDEIEVEAPSQYNFTDEANDLPSMINDDLHKLWQIACKSELFSTPITHLLTKAFFSKGIDQFIAHLLVIEASLGCKADYGPKSKTDKNRKLGSTMRIATRLSNLLGDPNAKNEFIYLFELRSSYLHGRTMNELSSNDLIRARRLARRTVWKLVKIAAHSPSGINREKFLSDLIQRLFIQ